MLAYKDKESQAHNNGGSKSHEICNLAYIFDYILNVADGVLIQLEELPERFGSDYNLEEFSSSFN